MVTEDAVLKALKHAHKETGKENLVMAGGVALNSAINGKVLSKTPFKRLWVQPNATDGGASMGAALFAHCSVIGKERSYVMIEPCIGPGFSSNDIRASLEDNGVPFRELGSDREIVRETAKSLTEGMVVGWFQGRMEWGPRALGNRSILADPTIPGMKDRINERVKHREGFRPFAPAVCEEDAGRFFEVDRPLPDPSRFMLMVCPVKEAWMKRIPAVTHVDGTARVQAVSSKTSPLFHSLIKEFGRRSGVPVLLNTSFNVRGEPIVCTPGDALDCFRKTGIDLVVMGRFLINKSNIE